MVRLKFNIDDEAIRQATIEGANQMGLPITFLTDTVEGNAQFVVALDDAEHCYRFGARVALIRAQQIIAETKAEVIVK